MTPLEALETSNDAYHVAVERILRDANLADPDLKAAFAADANAIFIRMKRARSIANSLYGT